MTFGKTPLLKSNNFAREIIATLSSQDTPRGGIVYVSQDAINASVSGLAWSTGFEPAISGVTVLCVYRFHFNHIYKDLASET